MVSPFRKNNQYLYFIELGSNPPKKVFKQIPNSIMMRLWTNSSNEDIFTQNKQGYEIALKNNRYKEKFIYKSREDNADIKNDNRKRKILWFTSPYKMATAIKKGRKLF